MPGEEEILKYTLDIGDVEAKGQRLQELLEQIKAKRAAKEDTSELEAQVGKEIDGLGKLADKEQEAAGTTEELTKQKDKLSSVMRVLGSQSAGMVGDLGGVVELLMQGGKNALMFGGALAGITAGVMAVQKLRDALREAREEQEKLNQAALEATLGAVERGGPLAAQLLALGGIEQFDEAARMFDSLRKAYGFKPGEAAQPAALATMAGLSVEQAGMMQIAMGRGAQVGTAAEAQQLFATMQPDVAAELRGQLAGYAKLQQQRIEAGVAQEEIPTGAQLTPIQALYRKLDRLGVLGLGAYEGVESVEDLQKKVEDAERLVREKAEAREALLPGLEQWEKVPSAFGGPGAAGRRFIERVRGDREEASAERLLQLLERAETCLLYTSPSPRDRTRSRMPSSA